MKKIFIISLILGTLLGYLTYYLTTGDLFPFSHSVRVGVIFVIESLLISSYCGMFLAVERTLRNKTNT